MKKEYKRHNNPKINYILNLYRDGQIFKALQFIHKYNQEYPKDLKGKIVEGKLLRLSGNPLEALDILEFNLSSLPVTSEFYCQALIEILLAEIALGEYAKAYFHYEKYMSLTYDSSKEYLDTANLRIFLLQKLKDYTPTLNLDLYDYKTRQIISFSKEESLKRVFSPDYLKNFNDEIPLEDETSYFIQDLDLKSLYEQILKVLPYAQKLPGYSALDYFIIKMNGSIGFDKIGELNHLKAVTYTTNDETINILFLKPYRVQCNKNFINNFNNLEIAYYINNENLKRTIKL